MYASKNEFTWRRDTSRQRQLSPHQREMIDPAKHPLVQLTHQSTMSREITPQISLIDRRAMVRVVGGGGGLLASNLLAIHYKALIKWMAIKGGSSALGCI